MNQYEAIEALIRALDGDTPMFDHGNGVRSNACPAMAYWMIKTLLWLIEEV